MAGRWLCTHIAADLEALPPRGVFPQANDSFISDFEIDWARVKLSAVWATGEFKKELTRAECWLIGMAFFDPCLEEKDPSSRARCLYYGLLGLQCDALASCGQLVDDEPMVMLHYAYGLLLQASSESDPAVRRFVVAYVLECLERSNVNDPVDGAAHALLMVELILEFPRCDAMALIPQLRSPYSTWEELCEDAAEFLAESPQGASSLGKCISRLASRENEPDCAQVLGIIERMCRKQRD